MPADERVTRSTFSGRIQQISTPQSMPQLPQRIWSDDDWDQIQRGYAARDMDEKWNVFTEGEVVFLHRSWSGNGVFAATFAPVDGVSPVPWLNVIPSATETQTMPTTASCSSW
jgi:hypothetical protein